MKLFGNTIVKNFSFLTIVHGVNLLSPILIIPYLIKVLGMSIYGEIVLAQSIMFYPAMVVGFGFNLIGTKEISKQKLDIRKRSAIINSILTAKFFLLTFMALLFALAVFSYPIENYRFKMLLMCSFWVVIQEATLADWYFQGVEKMQVIAFTSFISKVFAICYILIFVKSASDYIHVPLAFLYGILLSSIVSFFQIYSSDKNQFYITPLSKVLLLMKNSWPIFLSKFSQLYIRFNKILIGLFLNVEAVTLFDIGEKLLNVLKLPVTLFGQAIFPSFVQEKNVRKLKIYFKSFLLIHTLFFAVALIFQKELFGLFNVNGDGYTFFSIILLTLFPIAINVFWGNTFLFGLGNNQTYAKTLIFAGLSYMLGIILLYSFGFWSLVSISLLVLVSEISCSLFTIYYIKLNVKS